MSRSILIPLDGSPFSEQALPLARVVAERLGAKLEAVHVHDHQSDAEWELLTPFRFTGLERSERDWDAAEKAHEAEYLQERVDGSVCKVLEGPVVTSLQEEIAAADPDMIIMTTHGRGGFSRAWLGSVADQLIRDAHRPILLVRGSEDEPQPLEPKLDRILIPLDGSPLAESVIEHALKLAEPETSRITLLRVVAPAYMATEFNALAESQRVLEERVDAAHAYLGDVATRLSVQGYLVDTDVVVSNFPASTILSYAERQRVELICMATHGRSGVKRFLLGSVADKVLRAVEIPILIYRP